jgi:hypothetical protein
LWTMLAFSWAVAFLGYELLKPSRKMRIIAFAMIAMACAFRHNALSGAIPILYWMAYRECSSWQRKVSFFSIAGLCLLFTSAVFSFSKIPNLDPRVTETDRPWSVVTLWDASAVSLIENQVVIPRELKADSLSLQDLRNNFTDYTNTTVYESGKLKHSFDAPYTDEQKAALNRLLWSLPTEHTAAYFQHRLRLAVLLFGIDQAGLPDGQVFMPGRHQYKDNPVVVEHATEHESRVLYGLQSLIDTPLFAAWIYLMLALLLCFSALLVRNSEQAKLASAVACSSLCYALPLTFVSGSAEFRYLAWPVLASMMSLILLYSARSKPSLQRVAKHETNS